MYMCIYVYIFMYVYMCMCDLFFFDKNYTFFVHTRPSTCLHRYRYNTSFGGLGCCSCHVCVAVSGVLFSVCVCV